jgi:transcriptional regulator with XRE-family HTH domain
MAKKFAELRAKMKPESRAKATMLAQKYEKEMALDELREARKMTQEHLASLLNIKQPAIAKMERRTDLYLSTIQAIVKAMGGRLIIEAVFPDGRVEINQFRILNRESGRRGRIFRGQAPTYDKKPHRVAANA